MTLPRLVFMGTPDFAAVALAALLDAGYPVAAVYSQPPRPAGRGQHLVKSPVHQLAEDRGVPVHTPRSLRPPEQAEALRRIGADVVVVAAYGLILPQAVLDVPPMGCLNIHASLLPRWRGAAPIQRAILAGDSETGITIMRMEAGLDTGPMLLAAAAPIHADENAGHLHDRLARIGGVLIVQALRRLAAGDLPDQPQPVDGVTYAAKLDKAEGQLDFAQDATVLDRQVRALTPWPGCWFQAGGGERIKVLAAQAVAATGTPGTLLDDAPTIACGQGGLRLLTVQRPGRAVVAGDAWLRGTTHRIGAMV